MAFATRLELRGTHGMVASTHWLASGAGMAILEQAAAHDVDAHARAARRRALHGHGHAVHLNEIEIEERAGEATIAELRRRGHDVRVTEPWSLGRVSAVAREADGVLKAGANARGMHGYAVGR